MSDKTAHLEAYWSLMARYREADENVQKRMLATSVPLIYHSATSTRLKEVVEAFRKREWDRHYRGQGNPCLGIEI